MRPCSTARSHLNTKMCRFLLVRSKNKIKPETLLDQFAQMCEKSHAPDGDWQGDGWGIAIKSQKSKVKSKKWDIYKSLKPIWEEKDKFQEFEEINSFVVHARSSGFPQHRGNIEFNQPYISDGLCFVFNGMIKGVKVGRILEGKIGAQKIFSLILQEQKNKSMGEVLKFTDKLLLDNSTKIYGMNIGVVQNDKFYVLCEYEENADYFGIRYYQDDLLSIVCSEPIGNYQWKMMRKGDIISL